MPPALHSLTADPVPAFVDTLPPMQQLPLAPRSSGMIQPWVATCSSRVWSTAPASATNTPLACAHQETGGNNVQQVVTTYNNMGGNNVQ